MRAAASESTSGVVRIKTVAPPGAAVPGSPSTRCRETRDICLYASANSSVPAARTCASPVSRGRQTSTIKKRVKTRHGYGGYGGVYHGAAASVTSKFFTFGSVLRRSSTGTPCAIISCSMSLLSKKTPYS